MKWVCIEDGSQSLIQVTVTGVAPVTELDKQGFKIQVHFLLRRHLLHSQRLDLQPHVEKKV